MDSSHTQSSNELSEKQIIQIKAEIKQAATDHLNAMDAETALSNYDENVIALSNLKKYSSFEALAEDVRGYYNILKKVNLAVWDNIIINVRNADSAHVTAHFRYSFTDIHDKRTNLKGMWTILYIRQRSSWKIRMRSESFETDFIENDNY